MHLLSNMRYPNHLLNSITLYHFSCFLYRAYNEFTSQVLPSPLCPPRNTICTKYILYAAIKGEEEYDKWQKQADKYEAAFTANNYNERDCV